MTKYLLSKAEGNNTLYIYVCISKLLIKCKDKGEMIQEKLI